MYDPSNKMNKTEKIDLSTLKVETSVNTDPKKTGIQLKSFQQFSRVTIFANEMRSMHQLNVTTPHRPWA